MSQFFQGFNFAGTAVNSVTGNNGVTAAPTTGDVIVSGIDATTTTVGVASFNALDFNVSSGAVSNQTPNQLLSIVDDFTNNGFSTNFWTLSYVPLNGTASHPGLAQLDSPSGGGGAGFFYQNDTAGAFLIGGGILSVNWVLQLTTLSNVVDPYIFYAGMSDIDTGPIVNLQNGIYFTYTHSANSGNWVMNCSKGGVVTSSNTNVAAITGFVNLGFTVNAAATSVTFYIDGVSVGTVSTNLPDTVAINPFLFWDDQPGYVSPNLPLSVVDLFYLKYNLTTAR